MSKRIKISTTHAKWVDYLILQGYGSTPDEVVSFILMREFDDMRRCGFLPSGKNLETALLMRK